MQSEAKLFSWIVQIERDWVFLLIFSTKWIHHDIKETSDFTRVLQICASLDFHSISSFISKDKGIEFWQFCFWWIWEEFFKHFMSACIFFLVCSLLGSVSSFFMILFVKFQKTIRNYKVKGKINTMKVWWKLCQRNKTKLEENKKCVFKRWC